MSIINTVNNSETEDKRLPDFIIADTMKCGNTSLHKILNRHTDVFIRDREIHFFDMDDMTQSLIYLPDPNRVVRDSVINSVYQLHRKINPVRKHRPPKIRAATR